MNAPTSKHEAIASDDIQGLTTCLRAELLNGISNIPTELKQCKAWLCWRIPQINVETGKFGKIPIYPVSQGNRSGKQGTPEDLAQLGTFEQAIAAIRANPGLAGIGFAALPDFGIVALDADKCFEHDILRPDVAQITAETYLECSPSGKGVRAFWRGMTSNSKNHENGIELFSTKGFVTVTGNSCFNLFSLKGDDLLPPLDAETKDRLEAMARGAQARVAGGANEGGAASARRRDVPILVPMDPPWNVICSALDAISPDCDRKTWIDCGMALHSTGHEDAFLVWDDWSQGSKEKYDARNMDGQWHSFTHMDKGIGIGTLLHHARNAGWECPDPDVSGFFSAITFTPDWPDPHALPDLPPVPKFDLGLLPESIRPWVMDISERLQLPPDIAAIGAVTALSSAIGGRTAIRPKQNDSWSVVPNLWGMVVAPPGYKKSPALNEVMQPLHDLERRAHREYEQEMAAWEAAKAAIELRNSATRSAAVMQLKKDQSIETPQLQVFPDEPIPRRYVVNNFSLEALGEVMRGNPSGVLAFADELYGLLMAASKTGNEELHSFLLTGWNGRGAFTFDRIGRGKRFVENVCLSVLGGIQPGRLVEYLTNGGFGGAMDSGFANRFQLLTWPDLSEEYEYIDRVPNHDAKEQFHRIFERVAGQSLFPNLAGADAVVSCGGERRFDAEGQIVFREWLEANERLVRSDSLPPVMASHLAKFNSLIPSLALIFALADDVRGDIPARYARQAIGWGEYLRPHAERAFACTTRPDTAHARALLAKIKVKALTDGFTVRDVYRHEWSMLAACEAVEKAVALLVDHDYLMPVEVPSTGKGGRRTTTYRINPKIWT